MKRRKVNNLLALAILSALAQRPMHPYETATTLRAWGKDQDMEIKWGSLYTVVRNMNKHGLIEAVESTRQGGHPERTVYRITEAGHAEMADWARELIAVPEPERPRFRAGLSVMAVIAPDEVATLLRQRLDTLEARIADAREARERHGRRIPRLFLIETEYDLAVQQAEADWTRGLLDELDAGTFDGQAAWGEFHRTGALPPELAELDDTDGTDGTDGTE